MILEQSRDAQMKVLSFDNRRGMAKSASFLPALVLISIGWADALIDQRASAHPIDTVGFDARDLTEPTSLLAPENDAVNDIEEDKEDRFITSREGTLRDPGKVSLDALEWTDEEPVGPKRLLSRVKRCGGGDDDDDGDANRSRRARRARRTRRTRRARKARKARRARKSSKTTTTTTITRRIVQPGEAQNDASTKTTTTTTTTSNDQKPTESD